MIKSGIGTQGEVSRLYKSFNPPVVYFADRSKAVVPVLVLHFVALWFILRVLSLALCYYVLVFFSPFCICDYLAWEKRELILVLFVRLFDLHLFGFVCFLFLFWAAACDCGTPWTFLLPFMRLIKAP